MALSRGTATTPQFFAGVSGDKKLFEKIRHWRTFRCPYCKSREIILRGLQEFHGDIPYDHYFCNRSARHPFLLNTAGIDKMIAPTPSKLNRGARSCPREVEEDVDKAEKILVWGEVAVILIVLFLVFGGRRMFSEIIVSPLNHLLAEKLFDIVLALLGTILGYWLAKKHLEHFVSGIVKKMDEKYLDLNRQIAFRKAVAAMLPELPQCLSRPTSTFSTNVVTALGEFTSWSTAIDKGHTHEKSIEMVKAEAYTLAAGLIKKDLGFKEEQSTPNYEWILEVAGRPVGWAIDEAPDLSDLTMGTLEFQCIGTPP